MTLAYDAQHAELLAAGLPRLTEPVMALELACGRGVALRKLLPLLPTGSRVVALAGERDTARALHESLDAATRARVFVHKESAHRLPFAAGAFDLAWACFAYDPLEPQKTALRQALRVLKPRGTLLVSVVLRDTFVELLGQVSTTRGAPNDDSQRSRPLMVDHTHVLDLEEWVDLLRKLGVADVTAEKRRFEVTLASPPSRDPLFIDRLAPQWLSGEPEAVRDTLERLDRAVQAPIKIPITIACLRGRRGANELLPEDSTTGNDTPAA